MGKHTTPKEKQAMGEREVLYQIGGTEQVWNVLQGRGRKSQTNVCRGPCGHTSPRLYIGQGKRKPIRWQSALLGKAAQAAPTREQRKGEAPSNAEGTMPAMWTLFSRR